MYRVTRTGTLQLGYTETVTGNNIGSYGNAVYGSGNITLSSEKLLVIGPVAAFPDTLYFDELVKLAETMLWPVDILIAPPEPRTLTGAISTAFLDIWSTVATAGIEKFSGIATAEVPNPVTVASTLGEDTASTVTTTADESLSTITGSGTEHLSSTSG